MKITRIQAENFLGIRRADVMLEKPVVLFAGSNFAGKSSLQEAVRMALTGETVRVDLKKEYGALVNESAKSGFAEVWIHADRHEETATILLPSGKANKSPGFVPQPALPYVLNAQRFSSMDANARRAFLFGLMGVRLNAETVQARLIAKNLDKAKVDRIVPLLRAGFDAACKEASSKAAEAKGAWRALTGETYGAVKAKDWKATVPPVDHVALTNAQERLAELDHQLAETNQRSGALQAGLREHAARQTKIDGLDAKAAMVERIRAKLVTDEGDLAQWETKVAELDAKASGAAPVEPLACPHCAGLIALVDGELRAHVPPAALRDADAAAALPEARKARDLLASAVANGKRDLEAAQAAANEIKALKAVDQEAPPKQSALDDLTAELNALKARRLESATALERMNVALRAQKEADKKTEGAAQHHADVAAWDAIATALAPDGIPGDMLAEALEPINLRLQQSALDAEWQRVGIEKDMSITCGVQARPYALLSESEQWRADAMVAEAISYQSGLKLLVLDRFDVLDAQGRSDLLAWLDVLAGQGEIETALLFGTLKSLPSGLPATVAAEWIHNGHVGQLKEAA